MLTEILRLPIPQQLSGWVQNESHPDVAVRLQIINNGMQIGRVIADHYRFDLE